MKIIGKRVKYLRKGMLFTQQKLAGHLALGRSTLACYETGKRQIPYEVLIAIAKFFSVSTDYLLGLEDY